MKTIDHFAWNSNPEKQTESSAIKISAYNDLKLKMNQKGSIYVKDESGTHLETPSRVLGKGGSKKAIQLASGRALILPNMSTEPTPRVARSWERIVTEEVKMSKILTQLGLLSPLSEQVYVNLSGNFESDDVIPAYISKSFESFGQEGIFIIDVKNRKCSTWKEEEDFLFKSDEERLNEKNWDSITDSVLMDIAKICLFDIPVSKDSLNIAIIKKPSTSATYPYEIRFFGFDFSDKFSPLKMPKGNKLHFNSSSMNKIKQLLEIILHSVFSCEFGSRWQYGKNEFEKGLSFIDQLVEKYSKQVVAKVHQLQQAN